MVAFAVGTSGPTVGFGGGGGLRKTINRGVTPLLYACQQCDLETVKKILQEDPTAVLHRDRSGKTALHYCTTSDSPSAAQAADLLVMAQPDLVEQRDEEGFTPLHLAVIAGNMPLVTFLLANGADVNAVDGEKHSVVHWATVCGETVALRAVLAAGSSVSTPDVHGGYPLHYAAQMCGGEKDSALGLQVLHTLLSHNGVDVSVEDGDGRQPLLWAASAGSAKAVLALVRAGAAPEAADKDGLTALHCAASRGHTDCLDTLLTLCGAHPDVIDSNGCTALHYAVTLGHADATSLLLSHGADPDRQDRKGRSPAHCGCAKGQFETVKMVAGRGANLWLKNARGDLPLHEAAASGRRELVKWLLESRPSQVNARNNDGRCPLHLAALNDNSDMCKVLLDTGAQVNPILRTSKNALMTPLDCALQRGFRSTAKFLQCHGGVPASRLGNLRMQGIPVNSAVSLHIRDDVTFWGDTTSESELEKHEKSHHHKKSNKKRFNKAGETVEDRKIPSSKYGKGRFDEEEEEAGSEKEVIEDIIDDQEQKSKKVYSSEIRVIDRGNSVGIEHTVYSKNHEDDAIENLEKAKDDVKGRKKDTPDPRRKEFIDDPRTSKRQLLVELRKELISNENKSTQYSLDSEEAPESSSKVIERKVKSVIVRTETTTMDGRQQLREKDKDRQSLTTSEDIEEEANKILVEASIHEPPRQKKTKHQSKSKNENSDDEEDEQKMKKRSAKKVSIEESEEDETPKSGRKSKTDDEDLKKSAKSKSRKKKIVEDDEESDKEENKKSRLKSGRRKKGADDDESGDEKRTKSGRKKKDESDEESDDAKKSKKSNKSKKVSDDDDSDGEESKQSVKSKRKKKIESDADDSEDSDKEAEKQKSGSGSGKTSQKKKREVTKETTREKDVECVEQGGSGRNSSCKQTKIKETEKTTVTEVEFDENDGEPEKLEGCLKAIKNDAEEAMKSNLEAIKSEASAKVEDAIEKAKQISEEDQEQKKQSSEGAEKLESGRQSKQEEIQQLKDEIEKKVAEMASKATELASLDSPQSTKDDSKTADETWSGKTVVENKGEEPSTSREIESLKEDESQGTHENLESMEKDDKKLRRSSKTLEGIEETPKDDSKDDETSKLESPKVGVDDGEKAEEVTPRSEPKSDDKTPRSDDTSTFTKNEEDETPRVDEISNKEQENSETAQTETIIAGDEKTKKSKHKKSTPRTKKDDQLNKSDVDETEHKKIKHTPREEMTRQRASKTENTLKVSDKRRDDRYDEKQRRSSKWEDRITRGEVSDDLTPRGKRPKEVNFEEKRRNKKRDPSKPPSAFESAKDYDKRRREMKKKHGKDRVNEEGSESTEESGVQQDIQDSVTESERVEAAENQDEDLDKKSTVRGMTPTLLKADSLMLSRRKMGDRRSSESEEESTYSSTESSSLTKSHKSFTVIGQARSKSEEGRKESKHKSRIPTSVNLRRNLSKSDKHLDKHQRQSSQGSTRIPSLPNLVGDGENARRKRRPRSESNIPVPIPAYSEYELFGSGSDGEEITSSAKKRRWKRRAKRGKSAGSGYESNVIDSGFEPSPRSVKPVGGKWRNVSDRGVNMVSVQQTIQSNIRRYHLERKIFQHLLDLKRLQIRSGQHNEAVLVKRAIDAYHKSCSSTVGAGKYNSDDFTFKGFEHFLYHALRKLQKNGAEYLKGLPETPENPLFCTQSTHRCMHATHAYTGVPCAAYLPKLDHHTIPKIGFECKPQGFLPHIGSKKAVTLELSHGSDKQVISLPADRLDQNKRYYVTFTVKGHERQSPLQSGGGHRHPRSD